MQNVDIISKPAILYLPTDSIYPNPYQPRHFSDVKALTQSIKQYGVIEPINVRYINGKYQLVSGGRRLKAAKAAGLTEIPAVAVDINDRDMAVIALLENIQRNELNFFEEAEACRIIMEDFKCSDKEAAQMLCLPYTAVKDKLKLLCLTKKIRTEIINMHLSQDYAEALTCVEKEENQQEILQKIKEYNWNLKEVYTYINSLKGGEPKRRVKKRFNDIRLFLNTVKQAADIMKHSGVKTSCTVNHTDNKYEIVVVVEEGQTA